LALSSRCFLHIYILFVRIHTLQIEIEQASVGSLIGLGEGKEALLVIERQGVSVCIDGDESATCLAVVAVRCNDRPNNH